MATNGARRARRLGPHSRPSRIARLDRRSCEFRRLEEIRSDWLDHLGGKATIAQLTLIETVATSTLFCELLERDAFQNHGGIMPERSAKQHSTYLRARSMAARQLGLKAASHPAQSFAELFADEAEAAD
jgi:hypothetical protein